MMQSNPSTKTDQHQGDLGPQDGPEDLGRTKD
jgi:hypothetical protein